MKAEILSATDLTILPEISVLLFVAIFLGAIYRAFRPSAKASYENIARLALDDALPRPSSTVTPQGGQ